MHGTLEQRLADGDSEAAAKVESWVRKACGSFARRLGGCLEDVVQDSILEVVQSLREGRFRGEGSFRGYVWRTTASNCLDRLRHRRRWVAAEVDVATLPAGEASALRELLQDEARARLEALAAAQPRECRELWRDILAGLSYREMSERRGVAPGTLRVRVLRCRRRALATWLEMGGNETGVETPNSEEGSAV